MHVVSNKIKNPDEPPTGIPWQITMTRYTTKNKGTHCYGERSSSPVIQFAETGHTVNWDGAEVMCGEQQFEKVWGV